MAILARHKKTAEHFSQWLTTNDSKSFKAKVRMFDQIADNDYLDVKLKVEQKEKILKAQIPRKTKQKKF